MALFPEDRAPAIGRFDVDEEMERPARASDLRASRFLLIFCMGGDQTLTALIEKTDPARFDTRSD